MTDAQQRLDFDASDPLEQRDLDARALAVDPLRNVALEASAGTGKTRVLVDRYVALLLAGVKPRNILAITFTRKAAAEMRQRILDDLARRNREGSLPRGFWRELRDSVTDVTISTIDAFCLSVLREFPLEAEVDPGFELADETETPRLVEEALDKALRVGRGLAVDDGDMALLFTELGEYRLRHGLARLIDRRLVATDALGRFIAKSGEMNVDDAVARLVKRVRAAFDAVAGGVDGFLSTGPHDTAFDLLGRDLRELLRDPPPSTTTVQSLLERLQGHVLTLRGEPRRRADYTIATFRSRADYDRHNAAVQALGPYLAAALAIYRADINIVLARAVRRLFAIALDAYRGTLRKHGVLDFAEVLQRTLGLLEQMEEFSRSRYKLEARYQHVLVDEFQDTSRAQWQLVELLVRSWAEGLGLTSQAIPPTIFIVADRKQSIYAFRDAEVAVLDEAARYISALRPGSQARTAITRSFRSVRELLSFVNDLFGAIEKVPDRADAFRYNEDDIFPVASMTAGGAALGIGGFASEEAQAEAVGEEIASLLSRRAVVRDRETGVRREIRPGDIALLFRTREGHQQFERSLAARRIPYYVYKGLGFFDADEIKDVVALLAWLARPDSELRTAAFLRSRFVRLSDSALKELAPALSAAICGATLPDGSSRLTDRDRARLLLIREAAARWLPLVDRLPPAEILDAVLDESAYAAEIAGPSYRQARENLKKVRSLVRRIQNRGYATLGRIVDHFEQLVAGGDESNAIIDAADAVNLMTVHAAKGLEFPVVFVVNLAKSSGGSPDPIRVSPAPFGHDEDMDPSVAVGEHESAADKDADAREAEETKRLLYVATTRARDRLYLTGTLNQHGVFSPPKGSLGRVLPPSIGALFSQSAVDGAADELEWRGASEAHRLRALRVRGVAAAAAELQETPSVARIDDFSVVSSEADGVGAEMRRVPVTEYAAAGSTVPRGVATGSSLEAGLLLHRAIESGLLARAASAPDSMRGALVSLLREHERASIDDVEALCARAETACRALAARRDLSFLFEPAVRRLHEVPFSLLQEDGTIVRGAMDCLVHHADGRVDVLEFKTGLPLPAHEAQLALYVDAARQLFPGTEIQGRLIYC